VWSVAARSKATMAAYEGGVHASALSSGSTLAQLHAHYKEHGFFVIRSLYARERVEELLRICNRVRQQWESFPLTDNPAVGDEANYMRHINHIEYHREQPHELATVLNAAGDPVLLACVSAALGGEEFCWAGVLSLYFNPKPGGSADGFWHKDQIKPEPIHEWDDARDLDTGVVLHCQTALVPGEDLELVPMSQRRDYTKEERAICIPHFEALKSGRACSNAMPGAVRFWLEPGDALFFNVRTSTSASTSTSTRAHSSMRRASATALSRRSGATDVCLYPASAAAVKHPAQRTVPSRQAAARLLQQLQQAQVPPL
jgi:ectoine hydroxylase-related dioxygenase (phytanoyl-CoA dioxygenase family)